MKPSVVASFVVIFSLGAGLIGFKASVLVLLLGAMISCLFYTDRLLSIAGQCLLRGVHKLSFKPPANLVVLGVILSVVFVVIGLAWDSQHVQIPVIDKSFLTLLSIAGHFICLGAFLGFIGSLESASNFRKSRG